MGTSHPIDPCPDDCSEYSEIPQCAIRGYQVFIFVNTCEYYKIKCRTRKAMRKVRCASYESKSITFYPGHWAFL